MSTAEHQGLLMDAPQIMRELGVKAGVADKIVRWCAQERGRFVRPEGIRKLYVYREDVMEWLELNTQSAA